MTFARGMRDEVRAQQAVGHRPSKGMVIIADLVDEVDRLAVLVADVQADGEKAIAGIEANLRVHGPSDYELSGFEV